MGVHVQELDHGALLQFVVQQVVGYVEIHRPRYGHC